MRKSMCFATALVYSLTFVQIAVCEQVRDEWPIYRDSGRRFSMPLPPSFSVAVSESIKHVLFQKKVSPKRYILIFIEEGPLDQYDLFTNAAHFREVYGDKVRWTNDQFAGQPALKLEGETILPDRKHVLAYFVKRKTSYLQVLFAAPDLEEWKRYRPMFTQIHDNFKLLSEINSNP